MLVAEKKRGRPIPTWQRIGCSSSSSCSGKVCRTTEKRTSSVQRASGYVTVQPRFGYPRSKPSSTNRTIYSSPPRGPRAKERLQSKMNTCTNRHCSRYCTISTCWTTTRQLTHVEDPLVVPPDPHDSDHAEVRRPRALPPLAVHLFHGPGMTCHVMSWHVMFDVMVRRGKTFVVKGTKNKSVVSQNEHHA